ncbi:DNA-binding transcriptional LysR family regulator [Paraburkholderia sp. BL6669N2]|uniref:LysR family transcriptional regulator n=1 Tax=Paraburkholderia sp. BL6669N2 TaxID=1938807 RepID=UPI000E2726F4|nr:LysR family transcriptional regulator [Paraburkholderia sp. BL6669N2]REG50936.1 DNA-binding transcriptional LysR family regulator [Paraburkholderia sp. BL6669N2]
MNTLQKMRMFVRVVEAGSYTAAAKSLDSRTGILSRAVSELEAHLSIRLLNRSSRRFALTPAGERYFGRCQKILSDVENAEEEAGSAHVLRAGMLRMHSFAGIGQQYVLPAIVQYRKAHPQVTFELTLSQQMPQLARENGDVSLISASSLSDPELVAHDVGVTFSVLCASPAYLLKHGTPRKPADLLLHECLILKSPAFDSRGWTLHSPEETTEVQVDGPVRVNVPGSLAVAISEGLGIGMLPVYAAIDGLRDGTLVRVLPNHTVQASNVYVAYRSRTYIDARTRAWVEFLRAYLPQVIARDLNLLESLT